MLALALSMAAKAASRMATMRCCFSTDSGKVSSISFIEELDITGWQPALQTHVNICCLINMLETLYQIL